MAGRQEPVPERCRHGCDSRVKTVDELGRIRGYDAQTRVKGRKRRLLVDTVRVKDIVSTALLEN
jgi:hypothetical protein